MNVNEALRYVPTHAKALGQIACWRFETGFTVNMRRDADYYSRLAVTMAPSDPEMWRIRAEVYGWRDRGGVEAQERFMDLTGAGAPPEPGSAQFGRLYPWSRPASSSVLAWVRSAPCARERSLRRR